MSLSSTALQFPFTLYQTKNQFDDYDANDMRYGDLSENCLKGYFGLKTIVEGVDPWNSEVAKYPLGNYAFARPVIIHQPTSHDKIAKLLFDHFRSHSWPVSFMGNRRLFIDLVNHMQRCTGNPFHSRDLDMAYYLHILNDKTERSSFSAIERVLNANIDWDNKCYPDAAKEEFKNILMDTVLPKFNRWQDKYNGLSVSIHDVFATQITIESLYIDGARFRAKVHYKGQDHFGLDNQDIMNLRFHHIPVFRIWFVLQRWEKFGYRPFMTNMSATLDITGERTR
ncbi:DUF3289 family protein [Erwiniaceae bacterium BAC15a-03b]|uniref:DUF3289 family protein n=1 Tax=Winslowiella arboricola TaxID=2978220 RepID=A0A9J6PNQ9_9GAMM|nr:DUF3289 family protein [Winslowiella arboricola]MCU5773711.1 DUF3289 family protein [Winslowiella arboricola]MCU5778390.1 DUF3289 family protein [Winslowiella arboricola]